MTVKKERDTKKVGQFKYHDQCRFCYSDKIKKFLDFGYVPLAGAFLPKSLTKKDFESELSYPLEVYFCPECYLVQSTNTIPEETLFSKYFYFSSSIGTLVDYFEDYSKEIKKMYKDPKKRTILEIGCNDGVFLKPLKKLGFNVIGVDPARNVAGPLKKEGFNIENTFFNEKTAAKILKKYGKVDIIAGTSSLAHNDDIHTILKGVKTLLKDDGIFLIQEHYLGDLIAEMQYDMIYHEHTNYYSLLSIKEFVEMYEMEVFDIKHDSLRSGMMRYYIQNKNGKRRVRKSVNSSLQKEKRQGLHKLSTYKDFGKGIKKTKRDLLKLIKTIKKQGKSTIGYGASGRANTIMAYCGIDNTHIDYMVDDAPAKHGAFTPGNHLQIRSSEILSDPDNKPDYVIVFAWPFFKEIKNKKQNYLKNGGRFITPLPEVKVVSK